MQAPQLTCVLFVNTGLNGWQKMLTKIFQGITGLAFSIDAPNWLMYLHGNVDPVIFIKKLFKARTYTMLNRIDYGYEESPEETRRPNSHFMKCRLELNTLEESWYKSIIGALKTIQGVSFTIDAPSHMGYLCGNIEYGVLMKMLTKTGLYLLSLDYGAEHDLKPQPKKSEAPANGSETQPTKDTEPPRKDVSTVTKYQVEYKKSRGIRKLFGFK